MKGHRKGELPRSEPPSGRPPSIDLVPVTPALFELLSVVRPSVSARFSSALGVGLGRISEGFASLPFAGGDSTVLSAAGEGNLVKLVRRTAFLGSCRIVFVPWQLEDNWFSHWHPREQVAVVSVWDWNNTAAVPMEAFVAYEVLLNGLPALSAHYSPLALSHEETRGCLWDFCWDKREIEIKLQTMDLCSECRTRLATLGIDAGGVSAVCDTVREMASRPGS
jgi:hypothetical protein